MFKRLTILTKALFLKTNMSNYEIMTGIITGTLIKTVIFLTIYNNERK